jgi:hypothetical protein
MDKRVILIDYINNCSQSELDELYDDVLGVPDEKMNFIVEKLKPIITYIYFAFSSDEIDRLFPKQLTR